MAENKVRFGLKNVYYAVLTESTDGTANTYATPVAVPGAVSLTLDSNGTDGTFYIIPCITDHNAFLFRCTATGNRFFNQTFFIRIVIVQGRTDYVRKIRSQADMLNDFFGKNQRLAGN